MTQDRVAIIIGHMARPGVYIESVIETERGVKPGDTYTSRAGSKPYKTNDVLAVYETWDEAWAAYKARP